MGSGNYSTANHLATYSSSALAARGSSGFDYSDATLRKSRREQKPHPTLDPKGVQFRESRDSDEHPTSNAVAVLLDVTGSMGRIPKAMQQRLPKLFGILCEKGYLEHAQVLFGAVGDARSDALPLQVGQFESDNRSDDNLANIVLEGGGGGSMQESYELAAMFMARHTSIDCYEKRGKKGYLFIIGDEQAYPELDASQYNEIIGNDGTTSDLEDTLALREELGGEAAPDNMIEAITDNIPTEQVFQELRERYEVFFIIPAGAAHGRQASFLLDHWKNLVGENVIVLEDPDAVAETIGLTIGVREGTVKLEEALEDLKELGSGSVAEAVEKALVDAV